LAKTPRKWTGARSPSGLKRVRSSARRHEILQPRRSAAKTLVKSALVTAGAANSGTESAEALAQAMSALDRAAKVGAIHRNQAARRKSRLALAMNAASDRAASHAGLGPKTVSKAQAQKAAKARIAAGKADKAKGAQTAAGKARAALTKTSRAEAAAGAAKAAPAKTVAKGHAGKTTAKPAAKATPKSTASKPPAAKPAAAKPASKPAAKTAAKSAAKKAAKS
jgi:ribosomal protein S20